jgi:hypothetical protein
VGRGVRDHPSAEVEDPLELLDGALDVEQRHERCGIDPILIGVAPVLLQPLVEGPDVQVGEVGVVAHAVLDAHRRRREQDRGVEALLVHQFQPRGAVLKRGMQGHGHVRLGDAPRLERTQHLAQRTRRRDPVGVERLAEEREALIAEEDLRRAVGADGHPHPSVLRSCREVSSERVDRLVVVVVGVDEGSGGRVHPTAPLSLRRIARRPSSRELASAAMPAPTSAR